MDSTITLFETLKDILRHVRNPELLDDHPWTHSLIVSDALDRLPNLAQGGPGHQLISAIAGLFPQMLPVNPPRDGKRLDPRWGEFGIVAALYFFPFDQGAPFPTTLMDAWGRIDPAIRYFVYGSDEDLTDDQIKKYQLVGSDLEYGSTSTLSDWHKKGLQRFAELILNRERYLSRLTDKPSPILEVKTDNGVNKTEQQNPLNSSRQKRSPVSRRKFWLYLSLFMIVILSLGAFKGWRTYSKGRVVYQEAIRLRGVVQDSVGTMRFENILPELITLQTDLNLFTAEARPFIWLGSKLGWVPVYGGDLASAPAFVELVEHLLNVSVTSLQAVEPILGQVNSQGGLDPVSLTKLLVESQPQLLKARAEMDQVLADRNRIQPEKLSPRLYQLLTGQIDPLLKLADDGLSLTIALPGVLGATDEGPKTYLVLVQNEDELRPTGGFITSVGNLVLRNGEVLSLEFEGVDYQEDWTKPYPSAPWQLQEYMNSPVLILRDSNWFADFPTSALWAEYLYAYNHSHSVDGVIAFDQQLLVMLLNVLGPLDVEGAPYPITSENVIEYMRTAKAPPAGEPVPEDWDRKEFIREFANIVLLKIMEGENNDWRGLAQVLIQALEEHHLLLQFDDPMLKDLLADHNWDNTVHPGEGDFLMITDTNIGFNKTNALVNVSLSYDVDLTDVLAPRATLVSTHKNNADRDVQCIQFESRESGGDYYYPMNRCYWSYFRVYKQAGVELVEASPHAIPGEWMLLGKGVPARVDELVEEGLETGVGFGTLLVVPGGQTLPTGFSFALPPTVLSHTDSSNQYAYKLLVQKQPGTLAHPLVIRIHLPNQATLESTTLNAVVQDNNLLIETDLRTDVEFRLVFRLP